MRNALELSAGLLVGILQEEQPEAHVNPIYFLLGPGSKGVFLQAGAIGLKRGQGPGTLEEGHTLPY